LLIYSHAFQLIVELRKNHFVNGEVKTTRGSHSREVTI